MGDRPTTASDPSDPYWKLRPPGPTPDDELCACPAVEAIVLRDSLGANPLYCLECNGEVAPERIGFDAGIAEETARWLSVYRAMTLLWLDSCEYESWALARLLEPRGQVNLRGLAVVRRLNDYVRAYYWWSPHNDPFVDEPRPESCPFCERHLAKTARHSRQKCEDCSIVVAWSDLWNLSQTPWHVHNASHNEKSWERF